MSRIPAPRVEFDRLRVRYGNQDVIRGISLMIDPGTLVVLLGPSGSGKTSLLRSVNRMVEPQHGRVLIDDVDVRTQDAVRLRRRIGYVMQSSGLFPHRTVAENVTTVPRLEGMRGGAARKHAEELLVRVGLDRSLLDRYPAQLSGGQQQRVGVARALATEPRMLLMDEPFASVDPITRRALQQETLRLHRDTGATILFVTHDVDEALALGDRILVIGADGRVAQDGTPAALLASPASPFIADFLGIGVGERRLRLRDVGGTQVVTDAAGRAIGRIES